MGSCSPASIPAPVQASDGGDDLRVLRSMQASDDMLARRTAPNATDTFNVGFPTVIGPLGYLMIGSMLLGGD